MDSGTSRARLERDISTLCDELLEEHRRARSLRRGPASRRQPAARARRRRFGFAAAVATLVVAIVGLAAWQLLRTAARSSALDARAATRIPSTSPLGEG